MLRSSVVGVRVEYAMEEIRPVNAQLTACWLLIYVAETCCCHHTSVVGVSVEYAMEEIRPVNAQLTACWLLIYVAETCCCHHTLQNKRFVLTTLISVIMHLVKIRTEYLWIQVYSVKAIRTCSMAANGQGYCKEVDKTVTMRQRMRWGAEKSDCGGQGWRETGSLQAGTEWH